MSLFQDFCLKSTYNNCTEALTQPFLHRVKVPLPPDPPPPIDYHSHKSTKPTQQLESKT